MERQRVVIIGNSYTTRLGLIWSVAQTGCDITVIVVGHFGTISHHSNPSKPIDCYSKYISKIFYYTEEEGQKGLIELILRECIDKKNKTIIIPSSDFSASAIDNNQSLLKEHFKFPHIRNEEGSITSWMNKAIQKELARKIGLSIPQAVIIAIVNRRYTIPDNIKYPCFTKPMSSLNGGKKCVKKCSNQEELQEVLNIAVENGILNILVEDYIKIEKEYALLGFSDGQTVMIPGLIHFLKGSQTTPGIALMGEVIPVTRYEELVGKFAEYVREIGFVGIFDIDFFETGGDFYFGELNLRIGGSAYAITKMGVNLPAIFVKYMMGEKIEEMDNQIKKNSVYVNERICINDWYKNKMTTKEYKRILHSAEISFISNERDPVPQRIFKKKYNVMYVKRTIKKILCYHQ